MYDNLLFQNRLTSLLTQEVQTASFPPGVLFHGPARSGKLTVALETARALSCDKTGEWSCSCPACRLHRTLDYPDLILTGNKNFLPEILAGSQLLLTKPSEARRFFLIRAVKKLLKRFDPLLWEGDEAKLKSAWNHLEALNDLLETLYPPVPIAEASQLELLLPKIETASQALVKVLPGSGIPIQQVRRLSAWARGTSTQKAKFVLLENADKMQESARNALLKILEEPPKGTYFMLLTSQKGAILPTILSRVRALSLVERTSAEQQQLLSTLFHVPTGEVPDLVSYFQAFETDKQGGFEALAETFYTSLTSPVYPFDEQAKFWAEEDNFTAFLQALVKPLTRERPPVREPDRVFRLIQETSTRRDQFNLSASLLIETLFYRTRQIQ